MKTEKKDSYPRMFMLSRWFDDVIIEVEILKETPKQVVYREVGEKTTWTMRRGGNWCEMYPTWKPAHDALVERVQKRLRRCHEEVVEAKVAVNKVLRMEEPKR